MGVLIALFPLGIGVTAASADDGVESVSSTAYGPSEGGVGQVGASDNELGPGSVAVNGVPLGTKYKILSGPRAGDVVTVTDRNDGRTDFDIWMPDGIDGYGRQDIQVKRLD